MLYADSGPVNFFRHCTTEGNKMFAVPVIWKRMPAKRMDAIHFLSRANKSH